MKVGASKTSSRAPTEDDMSVGQRVRARRLMMGRSREWLAEVVGVAPQQIWKYENGISSIRASRIVQIAKALNVTVSFLFEGVERKSASSLASLDLLSDPLSVKLLLNFNNIDDNELRMAVLQLAQTLAKRCKNKSAASKTCTQPDKEQNTDENEH